jgi:hypothetical protein
VRGLDAVDVGRWRGIQTAAIKVRAIAPAPRIALLIMNQLSSGRIAKSRCDPTILCEFIPDSIYEQNLYDRDANLYECT